MTPDAGVGAQAVDGCPEVIAVRAVACRRHVDIVEIPDGVAELAGRGQSLDAGRNFLADAVIERSPEIDAVARARADRSQGATLKYRSGNIRHRGLTYRLVVVRPDDLDPGIDRPGRNDDIAADYLRRREGTRQIIESAGQVAGIVVAPGPEIIGVAATQLHRPVAEFCIGRGRSDEPVAPDTLGGIAVLDIVGRRATRAGGVPGQMDRGDRIVRQWIEGDGWDSWVIFDEYDRAAADDVVRRVAAVRRKTIEIIIIRRRWQSYRLESAACRHLADGLTELVELGRTRKVRRDGNRNGVARVVVPEDGNPASICSVQRDNFDPLVIVELRASGSDAVGRKLGAGEDRRRRLVGLVSWSDVSAVRQEAKVFGRLVRIGVDRAGSVVVELKEEEALDSSGQTAGDRFDDIRRLLVLSGAARRVLTGPVVPDRNAELVDPDRRIQALTPQQRQEAGVTGRAEVTQWYLVHPSDPVVAVKGKNVKVPVIRRRRWVGRHLGQKLRQEIGVVVRKRQAAEENHDVRVGRLRGHVPGL